jgi:cytochrome c-type biogenesis protein CcmH/NrfG
MFQEIEARARAQNTTVTAQAVELLAKALAVDPREAELLAEIRREREEMAKAGVYITDESIAEAKNWGRE